VPEAKAVNAVVVTCRCISSCLQHLSRIRNKIATYTACELHLQNVWWNIVAY